MENWAIALVGLFSAALAGVISWRQARSGQAATILSLEQSTRQLKQEGAAAKSALDESRTKLQQAQPLADKYLRVRDRLKSSHVVHRHLQPVILLGPRSVGKTSLLMQWHAPWDHARLAATMDHRAVEIPVFDSRGEETQPHFADEEISVPVDRHLLLKVHDFPGERDLQGRIKKVALEETETLRRQTNKNLGIVLACMFNAEEAHTGVSRETNEYYNGELFRELRGLVTFHRINIERLILIFNKYDLLRVRQGGERSDQALLKLCVDRFENAFSLLSGACHADRVCECFTVLGREDLMPQSQGATLVMGEAARNFVSAVVGPEAARQVAPMEATRFASSRF